MMQFEALKVALKQDATGYVLTVKIHPDEIPEELLRDFVGARYGVAMVRINDDEHPVPVTNRVQKAGMLCRSPYFQKWVATVFEGGQSETVATRYIHERCDISSRAALNGNKEAQEAFDEMVSEFDRWKESNDPF